MSSWSLAVDFGTTNTAAAYRIDNGASQPVRLSDQAEQMPSAILALDTGITVGHAAIRSARLDPQRFEVSPKRRLGEMEILLGPREWRTIDLIAAVLLHVKQKGMWVAGGEVPRELILTYPQEWAQWRQDLLRQAAVRAGFDGTTIRLVTEPIAAATWYASTQPVPPGKSVAVFDFGGGTCDVAVLRSSTTSPGSFEVIGADGIDPLGGELLDLRLLDWTIEQLRQGDHAELADALNEPENLAAMLTLREQVRHAKHELAEYESARIPVVVGPAQTVITVTIDEFDRLVGDEIDSAIELTRRTLASTGISPSDLHTLYLTGGSSHLRLVHRKMTEMLGRPPATLNDPKLVVAQGALLVPTSTAKSAPPKPAPQPAVHVPQPSPSSPQQSPANQPHLSVPTNYPGPAVHHTPSHVTPLHNTPSRPEPIPPGGLPPVTNQSATRLQPTNYSGSIPRPVGTGPHGTGPGGIGPHGTGPHGTGVGSTGPSAYGSDGYGPNSGYAGSSGTQSFASGPSSAGYVANQFTSGYGNQNTGGYGTNQNTAGYGNSQNTSQSGPQKKWLIPAIAAGVVAVIIAALLIFTGGSDEKGGGGTAVNGKGDSSMDLTPTGTGGIDQGVVICSDGSVAESQSLCPPPTEQTQVCSDGSEVAANEECPPEEPDDCWDGSTTTTNSCPALEGADALQWVFPVPDDWTRTCELYEDDGDNYAQGELEVQLCAVDQLEGARIYLSRWDSADNAKKAFQDAWGEGQSWDLEGDTENLGLFWSTQDENSAGDPLGVEASTYNNYGYSILVFFDDPEGVGKDMIALFIEKQQYRKSDAMAWATGGS